MEFGVYGCVCVANFCEMHGPAVLMCSQAIKFNRNSEAVEIPANKPVPHGQLCAGCCPVFPGETSGFVSKGSALSIYSSRYPFHQQSYSQVRQFCVRSLSVEFCPGREGPVLFGDEKSGYCLSYLFKLLDNQARGSTRWYAFIFITRDRGHLVSSWPFLVSKFKNMAHHLFQISQDIFISETRNQNAKRNDPAFSMQPDQFLRKRGTQVLRGLHSLLNMPTIYQHIHTKFSWILNVYNTRIQEIQSLGRNMIATDFAQLTHDERDLNQWIDELIQIFGKETFLCIIYELLIGNQLVLKGYDTAVISQIAIQFSIFLATETSKVLPMSPQYEPIWNANIIGLHQDVVIPPEIDSTQILVVGNLSDITRDSIDVIGQSHAVQRTLSRRHKGSSYMASLENILGNKDILTHLVLLKEEWIQYFALCFVNCSKSKLFFVFSKSEGAENETKLSRFLECIKCSKHDVPILRYLTRGLDASLRKDLLRMLK